jgi:hypothetical protein
MKHQNKADQVCPLLKAAGLKSSSSTGLVYAPEDDPVDRQGMMIDRIVFPEVVATCLDCPFNGCWEAPAGVSRIEQGQHRREWNRRNADILCRLGFKEEVPV